MITNELKKRIVDAIEHGRDNFSGSDAALARSLGINSAQFSRIMNGETEKVISDASWITLARRYKVAISNGMPWIAAHTEVFDFITDQLAMCQHGAVAGLLCDIAGIGKTFAAEHYARNHRNAIYVDCSQFKTRQQLIRYIAREYGVGYTGRYNDVYADLVYYLRTIENPLIILDEVGDLSYMAFLEIKALWNATEHCCGWYMMGADGLKRKITKAIDSEKVGFAEIFDRYGKKYQRASPLAGEELKAYVLRQSAIIIKANAPQGSDTQALLNRCEGSLRRIYIEVRKLSEIHPQ